MDGWTDGQTDRQTDRRRDWQTETARYFNTKTLLNT